MVEYGLRDKDRETDLNFPSMLTGKILFFIDANRRFIESQNRLYMAFATRQNPGTT